MGFEKKTWKDRLVEFAGRRSLTKVSGSADGVMVVDVARSEGNVSQVGDAFSAENMNDLEQRIADAIGTEDISAIGDGTVTGGISELAAALGGFSFYPMELTQAEYNALPAETKSTPKLLFVIKKE